MGPDPTRGRKASTLSIATGQRGPTRNLTRASHIFANVGTDQHHANGGYSMHSLPKRLVVVAVGVALLAGACGNSTSSSSGTPSGGGGGGTTPGTVSNADLNKMVHIDEVGITDTE